MTLTRKREQGRRLLRLIALLSEEGPLTTAQLAERLGCQQQEVQRDRRLLISEGRDVLQTDERPARYFLARPWHTREVQNDPVRAVIHHALLRLLHHHAPTPSRLYHETLLELSGQLPARLRAVSLRSLTPPSGDTPRILETLAAAWCRGEPVRFSYRKPGEEPNTGEADVVFMEINRTNLDWYVFARRRGEQRVKTFHLSRFVDAARLTGQSSPELPFDPRDELDGAWGIIGGGQHCEVTLRFAPEAVPYVAYRRWPGQIEGSMDGPCYVLRLRAPLNRDHLPVEVMAWIRGWGPRVEVLSPAWVRDLWLGEARELLARYGP
ncbi:DeoR family transcriptional regulator [Deinococcus aerius]|uniref:DeoR family transcriptional regulator n=1 Tax=Deinococcus aerius TaxID=200253 RepID=A0A2I9D110_9DEIO|nr:WYL domain-containing protein [Deinococcus aerius]GBF08254.1 DeoR family transcriptional regulator [Deinococcus aerius]